jgi:hypothetical protein
MSIRRLLREFQMDTPSYRSLGPMDRGLDMEDDDAEVPPTSMEAEGEVEIAYRIPGKGGFKRKKFPNQKAAEKFVDKLISDEGSDVEVRWAAGENVASVPASTTPDLENYAFNGGMAKPGGDQAVAHPNRQLDVSHIVREAVPKGWYPSAASDFSMRGGWPKLNVASKVKYLQTALKKAGVHGDVIKKVAALAKPDGPGVGRDWSDTLGRLADIGMDRHHADEVMYHALKQMFSGTKFDPDTYSSKEPRHTHEVVDDEPCPPECPYAGEDDTLGLQYQGKEHDMGGMDEMRRLAGVVPHGPTLHEAADPDAKKFHDQLSKMQKDLENLADPVDRKMRSYASSDDPHHKKVAGEWKKAQDALVQAEMAVEKARLQLNNIHTQG